LYPLPNIIKVIKSRSMKWARNGRDWKELERNRQWPISISPKGVWTTMEILGKYSRRTYQDSNAAPPVIFIIYTSWNTQKQNFWSHVYKGKFFRRTHNRHTDNIIKSEYIACCGFGPVKPDSASNRNEYQKSSWG
jgi:hypothetical protein